MGEGGWRGGHTNIEEEGEGLIHNFSPKSRQEAPAFFLFFGKITDAACQYLLQEKNSCGGCTHTGSKSLPHGHAANPTESLLHIPAHGRTSTAQILKNHAFYFISETFSPCPMGIKEFQILSFLSFCVANQWNNHILLTYQSHCIFQFIYLFKI